VKKVATQTGAFAAMADVALARQVAAAYHLLTFSDPWAATDQAYADAGATSPDANMTYELEFRTWPSSSATSSRSPGPVGGRPDHAAHEPEVRHHLPGQQRIDVNASIDHVLAPELPSAAASSWRRSRHEQLRPGRRSATGAEHHGQDEERRCHDVLGSSPSSKARR